MEGKLKRLHLGVSLGLNNDYQHYIG